MTDSPQIVPCDGGVERPMEENGIRITAVHPRQLDTGSPIYEFDEVIEKGRFVSAQPEPFPWKENFIVSHGGFQVGVGSNWTRNW